MNQSIPSNPWAWKSQFCGLISIKVNHNENENKMKMKTTVWVTTTTPHFIIWCCIQGSWRPRAALWFLGADRSCSGRRRRQSAERGVRCGRSAQQQAHDDPGRKRVQNPARAIHGHTLLQGTLLQPWLLWGETGGGWGFNLFPVCHINYWKSASMKHGFYVIIQAALIPSCCFMHIIILSRSNIYFK